MHSFSYHYKNVKEKERVRSAMEKLYDEYHVFYGGRKISDILDTETPLITFEADFIEKAVEPIEIKPEHYNYQRNKDNTEPFQCFQKCFYCFFHKNISFILVLSHYTALTLQ